MLLRIGKMSTAFLLVMALSSLLTYVLPPPPFQLFVCMGAWALKWCVVRACRKERYGREEGK